MLDYRGWNVFKGSSAYVAIKDDDEVFFANDIVSILRLIDAYLGNNNLPVAA